MNEGRLAYWVGKSAECGFVTHEVLTSPNHRSLISTNPYHQSLSCEVICVLGLVQPWEPNHRGWR